MSQERLERMWVIFKKTGEWDDVIDGPDVEEVVVVERARLEAALEEARTLRAVLEHAEKLAANGGEPLNVLRSALVSGERE